MVRIWQLILYREALQHYFTWPSWTEIIRNAHLQMSLTVHFHLIRLAWSSLVIFSEFLKEPVIPDKILAQPLLHNQPDWS